MKDEVAVNESEITSLHAKLKKDAEAYGYHLNPDDEMTRELVKGILANQKRYGYWNCPCRLASGSKSDDLDITCPCDYRDADVLDFGTCY
jgi:ferredoxin-thioredoxin reductase catalytic subunit